MDIIIDYIQEQLLSNQAEINLSAQDDLLGSGLIDSIGIMRLIRFIENTFDIVVPPEDMIIEHFMTVSDIETYINSTKSN